MSELALCLHMLNSNFFQDINKQNLLCEIKGGLGNQMFQIFTLESCSIDFGFSPVYKKLTDSPSIFQPRPIYWDTVFQNLQFLPNDEYDSIEKKSKVIKESGYSYDKQIFQNLQKIKSENSNDNNNKNCLLIGYFQSPKYFTHNFKEITQKIIKSECITNAEKMYKQLRDKINSECKIALHIRRGDYAKLEFMIQLFETQYYKNAINYITENTTHNNNDNKIAIFTDDLTYVKNQISFMTGLPLTKFIFIKEELPNLRDFEEMFLFGMFSVQICANSTFSWWGAYLGSNLIQHKEKPLVLIPNKWNLYDISDLIPKDWIQIEIRAFKK